MASFLRFALAALVQPRPASLLFSGFFCSAPITFSRGRLVLSFHGLTGSVMVFSWR